MSTIRCSYCRATHDSFDAFMACAHRRIAWDAIEYARDKADETFVDRTLESPPDEPEELFI